MNQKSVLVVDDEPSICWSLERMLSTDGLQVHVASSAEAGLEIAESQSLDLVLLDVRLPNEDGISALPRFIQAVDGAPVVIMTAFGDLETAVAAVRQGAMEYLTKPFDLDHVREVCRRCVSQSGAESNASFQRRKDSQSKLVGRSPAMQQAFRQIALVAASDLSVLITGETGTGKELVAAAIHQHSDRSDQPYLPIAPVALNPELVESELFGHVKGAFTGATDDHAGLFELAGQGTILLDEIGDLAPAIQVKLLRVLEQGEYSRVGEINTRGCGARILAATHCDLHQAVRAGSFREDLFFRLGGLHIHLPPLRERTEDLPLLCDHFQQEFLSEGTAHRLNVEVIEQLAKRPWHGNVRELRNAVEHACVIARGRPISIEDFPPPQPGKQQERDSKLTLDRATLTWLDSLPEESRQSDLLDQLHGASEPALLRKVLELAGGSRSKAADMLGIHRGTLREKLRTYELG